MTKKVTIALTASAIIAGASLVSTPAMAGGYPVFDAVVNGTIQAMQNALQNAIKGVKGVLNDMTNPDSVSRLLRDGFTQDANYSKASVAAQQQIANGQNAAMAQYLLGMNNTQIRDQQLPSPEFCATLDNNQTIVAASAAAWKTATGIGTVTDLRGEATPGSPSYMGIAQGVEANTNLHLSRYCSDADVQAGLCSSASTIQNGDQRASSLFGDDTYPDQAHLDAANDYVTSLIEPVAPAALRGDQLQNVAGKGAWLTRRSYNARVSLARSVLNFMIGMQTPSVSLNGTQQAELQAEGAPVVQKASWLQTLSLEVNRRVSGVLWAASLQNMPPASVQREIATEIALSNYIAVQDLRVRMLEASLNATRVAQAAESKVETVTPISSPNLASN